MANTAKEIWLLGLSSMTRVQDQQTDQLWATSCEHVNHTVLTQCTLSWDKESYLQLVAISDL